MKSFRTYQLAKQLIIESRKIKLRQPYRDQFERAVLSIALNLAEGSGKSSAKDRRRFYEIALGSLRETQALIEILDLNSLAPTADTLGSHIFCLCRSLRH